ncbi:MAG: tol-pal system protein YbgF [Desulfuromonadaceae bacterium]|nr:tol-pal system protein YbgF [Desulfuromonadaceae bacterium]MDD5104554.1 tol-pal system protein YbgF [Desulfuromonadaceae bacterium]
MTPVSRIAPLILLSILFSGCAANDLLVKRQAETDAKIEFLIQSVKKVEQRHNELAGLLQAHDEKLQLTAGEIVQLKSENNELRSSRDEMNTRVSTLALQLQTPKVEVVYQPTHAKPARESGPPAAYLKAFGLYSANNFQEAVEAFDAFFQSSPESDYAPNALYWIGECHYTLADLVKAKEAFAKVVERYPKSTKTPDALLKLGYTLAALHEKEQATALFEKIIATYPSSPAAVKARERLSAR